MLSRRRFAVLAAASAAQLMGRAACGRELFQPSPAGGPSFSVMLWTLKDRGTFEDNLEQIARAGYSHLELVGEYSHWSEQDWTRTLSKLRALQLSVDAMSGVSAGFADPAGADAFLSGLKQIIPTAQRLGCREIILLSGNRTSASDADRERQHAASITALQRAAVLLSDAGLSAVIEPIDRLENPKIYLDGVTEAFEIVAAVSKPNIKVLYDLYHEQRGLGNLIEKLEKNIDQVGLIHVADVPGRHEPGTGEIDYCNVYRTLARLQYRRGIAMEFYPSGDVVETLRNAREQALHCMEPHRAA